MKGLTASVITVFTVLLAMNSYTDELQPFTVTVESINIEMNLKVIDGSREDQSTEETLAEDSQGPYVVIIRTVSVTKRQTRNDETVFSSFRNGKVTLEAVVDERSKIEVTLAERE